MVGLPPTESAGKKPWSLLRTVSLYNKKGAQFLLKQILTWAYKNAKTAKNVFLLKNENNFF